MTSRRPRHGGDADGPADLSLTTIAAPDSECAAEIVRLYRLRWRIEGIFRSLKSDGLRLEETQMQDAGRLFKLAVIGLAAATRTVQLIDARDAPRSFVSPVVVSTSSA